jgi:Flp pilus assembly protein TadB
MSRLRLAIDNTARLGELEAQRLEAVEMYNRALRSGRGAVAALERLADVREQLARERARVAGGRCA